MWWQRVQGDGGVTPQGQQFVKTPRYLWWLSFVLLVRIHYVFCICNSNLYTILWNKCMTFGGWQLLVWKENFTFCCLYFYSIFWICNSNLYLILWKKSMTVGGWQLLIWKENFTDKSQPQIFLPGADFSFQTTLFGINSKLLKTFCKSWQLNNYS